MNLDNGVGLGSQTMRLMSMVRGDCCCAATTNDEMDGTRATAKGVHNVPGYVDHYITLSAVDQLDCKTSAKCLSHVGDQARRTGEKTVVRVKTPATTGACSWKATKNQFISFSDTSAMRYIGQRRAWSDFLHGTTRSVTSVTVRRSPIDIRLYKAVTI